ncbi:hypothetical protein CSX04_04988 [Burkholderia cepacia]|nr:hypothetical protein CSX04_04988 [Burkholderia cepacia]
MSAFTPGSKPVFQRSGAWPRVVLFVAVIVCVLVPAFAIALADRYARDTVIEHERVVANDIVASVDRILDARACDMWTNSPHSSGGHARRYSGRSPR